MTQFATSPAQKALDVIKMSLPAVPDCEDDTETYGENARVVELAFHNWLNSDSESETAALDAYAAVGDLALELMS